MATETGKLASQLASYEIFAGCGKGELSALAAAGGRFTLPAGWPLVQEGIPADACYVLTEGSARIFHQREQVAEVGAGDLVGEMTLFGGGQRRATVTSSTRVAGLRIEIEALRPLLAKYETLADAFRAVYSAHGGN